MNVELLERVKQHILEEPRRFHMGTYICSAEEWFIDDEPVDERPPCGTVACIAGWTVALIDGIEAALADPHAIGLRATDLLGLDKESAWTLFHAEEWEAPYRFTYLRADTPKQMAHAAASYIDHFIATNGAE